MSTTEVAVGRAVTGQMSPINLASGEAGEGARRGRQPKTPMAVFFPGVTEISRSESILGFRKSLCPPRGSNHHDSQGMGRPAYFARVCGRMPFCSCIGIISTFALIGYSQQHQRFENAATLRGVSGDAQGANEWLRSAAYQQEMKQICIWNAIPFWVLLSAAIVGLLCQMYGCILGKASGVQGQQDLRQPNYIAVATVMTKRIVAGIAIGLMMAFVNFMLIIAE